MPGRLLGHLPALEHGIGLDRPDLWLGRVVTNACISGLRRRATEFKAMAQIRNRGRATTYELSGPDEAVWAAVRRLPARQAQALVLVAVEDRAFAEVAAVLGCGEETVRTHVRRARATLATRLGTRSEDD